jgi:hypothetical protein
MARRRAARVSRLQSVFIPHSDFIHYGDPVPTWGDGGGDARRVAGVEWWWREGWARPAPARPRGQASRRPGFYESPGGAGAAAGGLNDQAED